MLKKLLIALAVTLGAASAHAQNTWPTPQSPAGGPSVGGGVMMCLNGSNQAVPCGAGAALPTNPSGSTGTDASANAAAIPISGYVLLTTIPVNASRAKVEVQNQSAGTIQVVLDDGAGANQTSILLAGVGASQQGGGWWSQTFKGRARIYGASGAQVSASQN